MNAHNKTQFTYARITCVLKDSNCDTPLPKILILAILVTCASSSSTKVSKCPHELDTMLTLKKRNTMHVFTHRCALIFQLSFDLAYSRSRKGLSKACSEAECK
ncbi:hypothetical protein H5410_046217, partial [Solanum commersonii]